MEQIDLDLLKVYLKKGFVKKVTPAKARYLHRQNEKVMYGVKKIYHKEDQFVFVSLLSPKERRLNI